MHSATARRTHPGQVSLGGRAIAFDVRLYPGVGVRFGALAVVAGPGHQRIAGQFAAEERDQRRHPVARLVVGGDLGQRRDGLVEAHRPVRRRDRVAEALSDTPFFFRRASGCLTRRAGSTDNHNAIAGAVIEGLWSEAQGSDGATPAFPHPGGPIEQPRRPRRRLGGGELARCDLLGAPPPRDLRDQRHAAARPLLRGSRSRTSSCDRPDLVERAYEQGTPMGGTIGPTDGPREPPLRRARARRCRGGGEAGRPSAARADHQGVGRIRWAGAREGRRRGGIPWRRRRRSGLQPARDRRAGALRRSGRIPSSIRSSAHSTTRAFSRCRPVAGTRSSAGRPGSTRSPRAVPSKHKLRARTTRTAVPIPPERPSTTR